MVYIDCAASENDMMRHNGRAFTESFILHGLLAGLVIISASATTPPVRMNSIDFSLIELVDEPLPIKHVANKTPLAPKSDSAPKPAPKAKPEPKIATHIFPKKIKQVKPHSFTAKSAVPAPEHRQEQQPTPALSSNQSTTPKHSSALQEVRIPSPQMLDAEQQAANLRAYLGTVRTRIEGCKRYPLMARSRRLEGMVAVRFVLNPNGQVSTLCIKTSSGYDFLDEAAIEAVRNASPMPLPPTGVLSEAVSMELNIVFKLI